MGFCGEGDGPEGLKGRQDLSVSVVSPVQTDDMGAVVTQNSSDAAMFQDAKYLCISLKQHSH